MMMEVQGNIAFRFFWLFALVATTTFGSDALTPEQELDTLRPHDGFEVNLFASEADGIQNPMTMRWDAEGRLFVVSTLAYPHLRPGQVPDDKIMLLEDTDGDGRADKSTVFARGLNIPTGIEIGDGGVYVGQETDLLLLKDLDGDGVADTREVVLTGFGTGDTHQQINSFVWSPGGELYFGQGDGIESRIETPWGNSSLFQAGIFRLRPRRSQIDGFLDDFMGPGNPWGIAFDDWGQTFIVDGAGGISFLSPAMMPAKHHLRLPTIGRPGGYCGVEVLGGEHLPPAFQGDFLVGDYKPNQVSRFSVKNVGSGFQVDWKEPLLQSSHRSFRPIDIRTGPDGAIYVCDWYNSIICHQDDPFRIPERDVTHGRIWRVSAKHRPPAKRPELVHATIGQLLDQLMAPERWTRYQAKRVLSTRDRLEVRDELLPWIDGLNRQDTRYELTLLEAVGVLESLEVVEEGVLHQLIQAKDYRARAYGARVVGRWQDRLANPLAVLRPLALDAHPLVRMEAIVASAHIRSPHAIEVAALAAEHPVDHDIDYALTQAAHHLQSLWVPAFTRGDVTFGGSGPQMAAVIGRVDSQEVRETLRRLTTDKSVAIETRVALLQTLIRVGDEADLSLGFEAVHDLPVDAQARILRELEKASRSLHFHGPTNSAQELKGLVAHSQTRHAAVQLIGTWNVKTLEPEVLQVYRDTTNDNAVRASAVSALVTLRGNDSTELLCSIASDGSDPQVRIAAIAGLCEHSIESAASLAADWVSEPYDESFDAGTIVQALLAKESGASVLARALRERDPNLDHAKRMRQAMSTAGRVDGSLMQVLDDIIGLKNELPEYSDELVRQIADDSRAHGDPTLGEAVFRSKVANCSSCHKIGDLGGNIGPDLSAAGTTLPIHRLIEEVVWPHRQIKEGYSLLQIVTDEGRVYQGYERKRRNTGKELLMLQELNSAELISIPRDSVEDRQEVGSAMPANVVAPLTRKELRDLIRYLCSVSVE